MIRTQLQTPQADIGTAIEYVDSILASCQYAQRVAVHRTLEISPGSLVFQRDMLLPIPIIANYEMIRQHRQAIINKSAAKDNLKRQFKDYNIGDEVLIRVKDPSKLQPKFIGPFTVEIAHTNGTVTVARNELVYERINARRLRPCCRRN